MPGRLLALQPAVDRAEKLSWNLPEETNHDTIKPGKEGGMTEWQVLFCTTTAMFFMNF
jgi:hypothetical protein